MALRFIAKNVGQESTAETSKCMVECALEIVEAQTDNVTMPLWRKARFD